MPCEHTNTNTICHESGEHEIVCLECDATVAYDSCPEAGTWPNESDEVSDG